MEATLVAVVVVALFFDFTNGFHDTANSIATTVSTRAMSPRAAVLMAAVLNVAGAFVSFEVAATIAKDIVDQEAITLSIVLAGLVGAITWNLITWFYGLPSSSSHALIGGMLGSAVVASGWGVVNLGGIREKVLVPSLLAPFLGVAIAFVLILAITWMVARRRPTRVNWFFRRAQLVSGGFVAFTHGTNDAQKTMGVIVLALVINGDLAAGADPPFWVIVSAATAIALGTYMGGWRIIKTMGSRILMMDTAQGFAAQGGGAAVILAASHVGFPLSTTHTISGGVMGAGAAKRLSAVRWGVAGNIVVAWVLTLPAAAVIGAGTYGLTRLFGTGAVGPLIISVAIVAGIGAAFVRRLRRGSVISAAEA